MRNGELALLGLALLSLALFGCTAPEGGDTSPSTGEVSGVAPSETPSTGMQEMEVSEEDLSMFTLDIDTTDDGFSTELNI